MPWSEASRAKERESLPEVLDSGGPLMPEQAAYDVRQYDLNLRIDPKKHFIEGTVTVEVQTLKPLAWLVLDLDNRLEVTATRQWIPAPPGSNPPLPFEQRGGKLWIDLGRELPSGQRLVVAIDYHGHPRTAKHPPWDGGFTWSKTKDGQPWIATAVQEEGADLWWPCKDHPSDKPDSVTLRITVPRPLVVASNGRLIEVLDNSDGTRTYHWHTSMPISNYNVALNIAPYKTIEGEFKSVGGETVPVTYWVLPENLEQGKKLFPEFLEHLRFYERFLGPYPFRAEKYGVAETPHLGMEHQSIIAYGNHYRGGPHGFDWLHHHELGHEWWGNLVTARDWRHFWLHEGLCTYMQALYAEEREGIMAYHHALYETRKKITNKNAVVPDHAVGMHYMSEAVGNDVYYKGAWILHTLRFLIGKEALLTSLRCMAYPTPEWEKRTDGSACRFVTTEDFIQVVEAVSGRKLDWFFNLYLRQPKLPVLVSEIQGPKLILKWETPPGYPFPMPLEVQAGPEIKRLDMPDGKIELKAVDYPNLLLDPQSWILKKKRLVSIGSPSTKL
jgi:aminopeptidase N